MSIDMDTVVLNNQAVAKEGVLPYNDGNKLKLWEHLKQNIGKVVPVLDEHPSLDNGMNGLFSGKEKVYGMATLKQCPKGGNRLCADMVLQDGSPIKYGYSIGYPYKKVKEKGNYNGKEYDTIQAHLTVNHISLTDDPRDEEMLQVIGDSRILLKNGEVTLGKTPPESSTGVDAVDTDAIYLNSICYDSYRFDLDARIDKIKEKLARSNPEMDAQELNTRALVMFLNEKKLENRADSAMPEDKKTGKAADEGTMEEEENPKSEIRKIPAQVTGDTSKMSNAELREEIARLQTERDAKAGYDATVKNLERKLKNEQDSKENYKKLYEGKLTEGVQRSLDSLNKEHGFDLDDFKGKSSDFIDGALFASSKISKGPDSGSEVAASGDSADTYSPGINDYVYDRDSKQMVLRPEIKSKMERKSK